MVRSLHRGLLPLAALALAALSGGCVAYPAYPAYAYYNGPYYGGYYGVPYYSSAVVAYGGDRGWRGGWRDRDWHR